MVRGQRRFDLACSSAAPRRRSTPKPLGRLALGRAGSRRCPVRDMMRAASCASAGRSCSARGLLRHLLMQRGPRPRFRNSESSSFVLLRAVLLSSPSVAVELRLARGRCPAMKVSKMAFGRPAARPVRCPRRCASTRGPAAPAGAAPARPSGLRHEVHPHRQRGAAAFLAWAERALLVEADPGRRDQLGIEAAEPRVAAIVGRAGLAGEIAALQLQRARGRCRAG